MVPRPKGFEADSNISNNIGVGRASTTSLGASMITKLIGTFIILAAFTIGYIVLKDDLGLGTLNNKGKTKNAETCVQLTPAQQLSKMINDDFQTLTNEGQLPAEWSSIATVELRMNSTLAKTILGKERPNIQRVKEGANYLELEIVDLPDEENPGIIIQASLFDIKSKNKIFEIGRTYTMNDLNRVTPEPTKETSPLAKAQAAPEGAAATPAETPASKPTEVNTPAASSESTAPKNNQ